MLLLSILLVVNYYIWLKKCTIKTCEDNIAFPW